jgi:hypothetical protein
MVGPGTVRVGAFIGRVGVVSLPAIEVGPARSRVVLSFSREYATRWRQLDARRTPTLLVLRSEWPSPTPARCVRGRRLGAEMSPTRWWIGAFGRSDLVVARPSVW